LALAESRGKVEARQCGMMKGALEQMAEKRADSIVSAKKGGTAEVDLSSLGL
jgi:hypothetical protein